MDGRRSSRAGSARSLLAVAGVVAALGSGCGTSGGERAAEVSTTSTSAAVVESSTTSTTSTTSTPVDEGPGTTATTSTVEPSPDPEAQARAEAIDLTLDDFGDGWSASPRSVRPDNPIEECDPRLGDSPDELAVFYDDEFTLGDPGGGDGIFFTTGTKVFVDEAAASDALAPYADPEVLACIDVYLRNDVFGEQFGNTIVGEFVADEWGETEADEVVSASAEYAITSVTGVELDVVVAVAILRSGDVATQLVVQAFGPNVGPADLAEPIARVEELHAEL